MKITALRLQNFQKHRAKIIRFEPGLNLIVGPSDHGKSAVFRALRWLALHGTGTGLTTHGENTMRVGAQTPELTIMRYRQAKKNGYKIGDMDYNAVGTTQPEEIRQALRLSEINFQGQHDPPFLLGLTPGQVARELNKIVDLEAIDTILSRIKSAIATEKAMEQKMIPLAEQHQAEADATAWSVEASADWASCLEQHENLVQLSEKIHDGQGTVDAVKIAETKLGEAETVYDAAIAAYQKVELAKNTLYANQSATERLQVAVNGVKALPDAEAMVDVATVLDGVLVAQTAHEKAKAGAVKLAAVLEALSPLDGTIAEAMTVGKALSDVAKAKALHAEQQGKADRLHDVLADMAECAVTLKTYEADYRELEKEAELCPTCKRPL